MRKQELYQETKQLEVAEAENRLRLHTSRTRRKWDLFIVVLKAIYSSKCEVPAMRQQGQSRQ